MIRVTVPLIVTFCDFLGNFRKDYHTDLVVGTVFPDTGASGQFGPDVLTGPGNSEASKYLPRDAEVNNTRELPM